ncbi:hypothetical protein PHLCEN_2v8792 [Hermanssonia centrifuga]|uniref:ACB domain-containing protein n=1 Tax=Hermanssonia centrifuga TaxID=98765 RepID=A0A2R6NSH8_9APHY|nr:hypothetical protein PHLCEN_2v8792 [Hermanssonia centrifuga]
MNPKEFPTLGPAVSRSVGLYKVEGSAVEATMGGIFHQFLYGLFKFLTVSPSPTSSRPSIFDFAGRAKWDAWKSTGQTYSDRPLEAEKRYLEIARELGWHEGASSDAKRPPNEGHSQTEEDIWDSDSDSGRGQGSGGGLGAAVSTMTLERDEGRDEGSVHSLAVLGKAEELKVYLNEHPGTNLDELDEFGYTPLHLASDRGHVLVVKLLLSQGSDWSLKDPDDFTALELARIAEHDDVVSILESNIG